ncbi:hypothetical protein Nepgr_000550 [Nepenthes gracilis]|uniref:Protein ROOT INITIATION DEFECTIVE 3 n=1 Tax=Nepenthes gracilis TaxID=150966 RepID=A0AAD3P399_NEPGR|nr:hypothetical protein Nepgr_000550 [Nepenthes gracilis]
MEVVVASSSIDAGIGCWDIRTGNEQLRYKSCASPPHGLVSVGNRFLASSQPRESSTSGSILYWSWKKPQVEVKSFPAEPIKPLVSNSVGSYLIGGGASGYIYFWEVPTGRLLWKWHAHYRAVTCLVLSDDDSLLISGSEDGCVRVWSLFMIFDKIGRAEAKHLYEHSFSEHTLRVTDVVAGYGGSNAIIVSASEDRTCKVWSLSKGRLLRNIEFPSIINAIALDPGEHVFFAGGRDGKIYIAALGAGSSSDSIYGMHIIGSFSDHSKSVTCLSFCADGISLVSGSEDGLIRIWDTKSHNIIRMFRHSKGPVSNVLVVSRPEMILNPQASLRRKHLSVLPPALERYSDSTEEAVGLKAVIPDWSAPAEPLDVSYISEHVMNNQIEEIQRQGSYAAAEMETERLKQDLKKAAQMLQQLRKSYDGLHEFCVNELMSENGFNELYMK